MGFWLAHKKKCYLCFLKCVKCKLFPVLINRKNRSNPNPNVSSGSQVSRPVPHSDSARIKATDRPIVFSRSTAHHPRGQADKWSFSESASEKTSDL